MKSQTFSLSLAFWCLFLFSFLLFSQSCHQLQFATERVLLILWCSALQQEFFSPLLRSPTFHAFPIVIASYIGLPYFQTLLPEAYLIHQKHIHLSQPLLSSWVFLCKVIEQIKFRLDVLHQGLSHAVLPFLSSLILYNFQLCFCLAHVFCHANTVLPFAPINYFCKIQTSHFQTFVWLNGLKIVQLQRFKLLLAIHYRTEELRG